MSRREVLLLFFSVLLALLATLTGFLLWRVWYPGPFAEAFRTERLFWLWFAVSGLLGPTLIYFVAKPAKRRGLVLLDAVVLLIIQLLLAAAFVWVLAEGRPVRVLYWGERLHVVRALDIDPVKRMAIDAEIQWNYVPHGSRADAAMAEWVAGFDGRPSPLLDEKRYRPFSEGLPQLMATSKLVTDIPMGQLGALPTSQTDTPRVVSIVLNARQMQAVLSLQPLALLEINTASDAPAETD